MMKKLFCTICSLSIISFPAYAQIGGIEDSVADIADTIRAIFPIILGVIFLVGFLLTPGISLVKMLT